MDINQIEYIGYLASFLVAISFTLKNIVKLRVINSMGGLVFIAYGVAIDSVPVIITNGIITLINIYYLSKKKQLNKIE